MIDQWQSHTPEVANLWWKADEMAKVYDLMAAPWWNLVKQHSAIHAWSRSPEDDYNDSQLIYLHTTSANFQQGCDEGNLKGRFLFRSPGQALLHRTVHHHFGLSSADLSAETFVVQCKVSQEWLASEGSECVNGFATSVRVESMSIEDSKVQVVGVVKILSSLVTYLSSDAMLHVTRQSISHFDCVMHSSGLGEYG
eukprot:2324377-Amphidinium_carterae.1